MSAGNLDIEAALETLPDEVAKALEEWRIASLDREKCEAILYLAFKAEDEKRSAMEIKSLVNADNPRYETVLKEIKAEAAYSRLSERLMAIKKRASLRTAF